MPEFSQASLSPVLSTTEKMWRHSHNGFMASFCLFGRRIFICTPTHNFVSTSSINRKEEGFLASGSRAYVVHCIFLLVVCRIEPDTEGALT